MRQWFDTNDVRPRQNYGNNPAGLHAGLSVPVLCVHDLLATHDVFYHKL